MTVESVVQAMKNGAVFGVDVLGIEHFSNESKAPMRCTLHVNTHHFIPTLIESGVLPEDEVCRVISSFDSMWSVIDDYYEDGASPVFMSSYRFFSAVKPNQVGWMNPYEPAHT